ncbi:MAG: DUF4198 domain-containing protein [Fimbriiglobus sp.]
MRRMMTALFLGLSAAAAAHAHAVYVVPTADGQIVVVFSDDLKPDARIKDATWRKLDGLTLTAKSADGTATPVKLEKGEHSLKATVPAGTRVVVGAVDYGVSTKGTKPALLKFYPKAVLGELTAGGKSAAGLDIVPSVEAGKVRFQVLAAGKPVAGAKVSVMLPEKKGDAEKADATTDETGQTPAFEGTGRFAVTVRHVEPTAGERNGEKYEQVTHVATLVVDVK